MIYRYNDIRYSDVACNTLSLGNIPIRVEKSRMELVDPSPLTPPTDPDGCDTPNLSLSTCRWGNINIDTLRRSNNATRRMTDKYLIMRLGSKKSLVYRIDDTTDAATRSVLAFFGQLSACEIDAVRLPARSRSSQYNPRIPTHGDPAFRTRSGRYRRFRRFDTHSKLLDSSWVGPASRSPQEIVR